MKNTSMDTKDLQLISLTRF